MWVYDSHIYCRRRSSHTTSPFTGFAARLLRSGFFDSSFYRHLSVHLHLTIYHFITVMSEAFVVARGYARRCNTELSGAPVLSAYYTPLVCTFALLDKRYERVETAKLGSRPPPRVHGSNTKMAVLSNHQSYMHTNNGFRYLCPVMIEQPTARLRVLSS